MTKEGESLEGWQLALMIEQRVKRASKLAKEHGEEIERLTRGGRPDAEIAIRIGLDPNPQTLNVITTGRWAGVIPRRTNEANKQNWRDGAAQWRQEHPEEVLAHTRRASQAAAERAGSRKYTPEVVDFVRSQLEQGVSGENICVRLKETYGIEINRRALWAMESRHGLAGVSGISRRAKR